MPLIGDKPTIGIAHVAYRFGDRMQARGIDLPFIEMRTREDFAARIAEIDVLLVSGYWNNALAPAAKRLKFIQSISAGVDQYDPAVLRAHGIRLASAAGGNANAVSEHAISLILAISRRLPEARDNQAKKFWRGMQGDFWKREDELGGKTLAVVGLGRIGGRLARLARAFGMHVIGLKRDPSTGAEGADEVHAIAKLHEVLPRADYVALCCPLTPETQGLIGTAELALMKPSAHLVNVARGKVVKEAELIAALNAGTIKSAALDCVEEEPLPEASPLWTMPNVFITPHTGGETCAYEDNVLDFLMENLGRLQRGEDLLLNQVV
ncbi:MAG TPA: D-2-hydroxyacid dehydrogenase [Roseomonas sp.]|jgi:phosphoglycerate dehydrogenase-like enzyme